MHRVAITLPLLAVVMACGDDDVEVAQERVWMAEIVGTGDFQALRGESIVRWIEGARLFTATITLENDAEGSIRPWHVHFGTCATGGAIVGEDLDYPRLMIDETGSDSVSVSIARRLDPAVPYHVNVHLSNEDLATIIACGDLALDGDADAAAGPPSPGTY